MAVRGTEGDDTQSPYPRLTSEGKRIFRVRWFCRLWIPNYAELAKPLYEATKSPTPFNWTERMETSFKTIKTALLSAPALGLPDVTKPFLLYVDEKQGVAKGLLIQHLGP